MIATVLAELELGSRVFSGDGGDGREEEMGSVGHPVDPLEFAQIGLAAVDVDSASEVRVVWRVFGEEELGPGDLEEGFLDGVQLGVSELFASLLVSGA